MSSHEYERHEHEANAAAKRAARPLKESERLRAEGPGAERRPPPTPGAAEREIPADVRDAVRDAGRPLEPGVRAAMEQQFGHDFSRVRVHAGAKAAASARAMGALAYTTGWDIVFGAGRYALGTGETRRLVAHELAHVVQQTSGASHAVPAIQRKPDPQLPTKVIAHGASAEAVKMAESRMTEVLGNLKDPAAGELKGANVELHIIPKDKKLTDLPEFASLKGTKTFDGRNYDDLRGVGGTKVGDTIRYAIAEEQLVPVAGKPSGYAMGFVAGHESGHIVEQYGLTADQKKDLQDAYDARKKAGGPWLAPEWYTKSNTGEYFAQSTAAYFNRPYSTSDEDKKTYTRDWLKTNDPAMHKLLSAIYK